ncbi:MAG: glycosyltransferase [Lachnospiraceae bacterium]|nr:glycosyltransferase [Lachnospiraceae bacterium]
MNPKITIVTISYNCSNSIERTISSVINQNYDNIEYVVIDGASTDDTINRIKKFETFIDVFISEPDKGISDAFNKGIKKSSGDLIMFLNAGDYLISEDSLEQVAGEWAEERPDVIFYNVCRGNDLFISAKNTYNDIDRIWRQGQIPHQGAFTRREVFERIGYFDTQYKIRMDFDFWMRCVKRNLSYKFVPRVISDYEIGGTSMQVNNAKKFYKEGFEIRKKYGMKIPVKEIVYYLVPNWIRKINKGR